MDEDGTLAVDLMRASAGQAARAAQRRLRVRAPGTAAAVTWAVRRRRGDRALAVVDKLVGPGQAVADVGANWGLFVARFAHLVGQSGVVHAFEPHPAHAPTLAALARRNPSVRIHPVALGNQVGDGVLHVPVVDGRDVNALASLAGPPAGVTSSRTVPVALSTLDDALAAERPLSFVKCDVEGLEADVLQGGRATLSRSQPTLLIEIEQRHSPRPITETFEQILGLGYEGWCVRPEGLRRLDEFDVERDQLRFLDAPLDAEGMPLEYVNDFVFARAGTLSPAEARQVYGD